MYVEDPGMTANLLQKAEATLCCEEAQLSFGQSSTSESQVSKERIQGKSFHAKEKSPAPEGISI